MADRTVYGNNFSENGWRMVDQGSCVWVKVPGTSVTLQIREGQPAKILGAFAADFNAYVEPLRDADSACWTATNSVGTSNHLSGTGMDLNWNGPDGRTFRLGISKEQAYPGPKAKALDDLIAFYEGMVFCGGNWSIRDWMHMQMGGGTYGSQNVAKVNDFIARKIRPDGFSTYKRAGTPAPPKPPAGGNAVDVLARATGLSPARATEILPTMVDGLKQAQCTNVNRIAMFIAQTGHESANFQRTEEYASGAAYEGRVDLGNTQPGDGVRFKGRTWIQITGRHNYGKFSQCAHSKGLVPTPTYFVDRPVELQDLRWAGIGAAWYWTVARTDINALSDKGDIVAVTQRINGGQNGITDRRERYRRAINLGDQLLTLTATTPSDPIEELLAMNVKSWSIYATPGEPEIPVVDLIRAIDAKVHRDLTDEDARAGDPEAIRRVARTAAGLGANRSPGAISHAVAVLNEINATNPQAILAATPERA